MRQTLLLACVVLLCSLLGTDHAERIAGYAPSQVAHRVMPEQEHGPPGSASQPETPQAGLLGPRGLGLAPGEKPVAGAPTEQPEEPAEDQRNRGPKENALRPIGPQQEHKSLLSRVALAFLHALDRHANAVVALFTVVLTVATSLQWYETRRSAKAAALGASAAKQSAEAAERQSRMLLAQEAPFLVFRLKIQPHEVFWEGVIRPVKDLAYVVANHGRTPALVESMAVQTGIRGRTNSVVRENFSGDALLIPAGATSVTFFVGLPSEIDDETLVDLRQRRTTLFFRWSVRYRDVFDVVHEREAFYSFSAEHRLFEQRPTGAD